MSRKPPPLSRRERADATRARMCDAAYDLFSSQGYGRTTIAQVAERAGVAVQTVYFTFHTKAELLTAVVIRASGGGEAGTPVMDRAWLKEALSGKDGQRSLALAVEHGLDIFRRMAPLWDAMAAAGAEDHEFAERFAAIVAARRRGMRALCDSLDTSGHLAEGTTAEAAADSLFLLQNPELFRLATGTLGWSVEHLKAWCFVRALPLLRRSKWRPAVTADLGFHDALATMSP